MGHQEAYVERAEASAHQHARATGLSSQWPANVLPMRADAYCVVDWDNCVNRGSRPRATLDWAAFANALRGAGVVGGTSFAHRHAAAETAHWRAIGLDTVSFNANVDEMAAAALRYFGGISSRIILVGGDGCAYTETVRQLAGRGVSVEVWARSHSVSQSLIRAADAYRSIDRFLHAPADRLPAGALARAA